jgi:hypothetical protein
MWLDLNHLEIFVQIFFTWLKQKQQKTLFFYAKFLPHFNQNNANIKIMNVLPMFCNDIKVFFIKILQEIEIQIFCAFLSTESLFTFSTF